VNHRKKYNTIADLLTDDGFLAWYLKINDRYEQAWNRWINENRTHAQLAKKAVQLLSVIMSPETDEVPQQQINASFDRLYNKIIHLEKDISPHR